MRRASNVRSHEIFWPTKILKIYPGCSSLSIYLNTIMSLLDVNVTVKSQYNNYILFSTKKSQTK